MPNRIVLLGTGTCQLQQDRMASSVLIELDGLRLVFDFGRGIAQRLTQIGLRQDDIEHVVLSHFHPDHLSDLIPFLQAASWSRIDPRQRDLHIYGPLGVEVQLMRLLGLFGPDQLTREHFRVRLHEVRTHRIDIGEHRFEFGDLPPAGNHGLKFSHGGKTYAMTGDSSFHDQEITFLNEVDLAIIDAGHLDDREIVELAVRSKAHQIVCSHLYRELDIQALNQQAQDSGYRGRLVLGHDLMSFELYDLGATWSRIEALP